jgi:hypothetical protein
MIGQKCVPSQRGTPPSSNFGSEKINKSPITSNPDKRVTPACATNGPGLQVSPRLHVPAAWVHPTITANSARAAPTSSLSAAVKVPFHCPAARVFPSTATAARSRVASVHWFSVVCRSDERTTARAVAVPSSATSERVDSGTRS